MQGCGRASAAYTRVASSPHGVSAIARRGSSMKEEYAGSCRARSVGDKARLGCKSQSERTWHWRGAASGGAHGSRRCGMVIRCLQTGPLPIQSHDASGTATAARTSAPGSVSSRAGDSTAPLSQLAARRGPFAGRPARAAGGLGLKAGRRGCSSTAVT
ncbi:hypothetical protein IQ07DRAFT_6270 [Pyrenochaeta sp. DS3sAY3a]|nr:hypothetical protein IQ07DRAFT_6270 [Pyrenochaeta sp. DS3sAY3a]